MIIGGFLIDYFGKVKMISIYLSLLILLVDGNVSLKSSGRMKYL